MNAYTYIQIFCLIMALGLIMYIDWTNTKRLEAYWLKRTENKE